MKVNAYAIKKVITFTKKFGIKNTVIKSVEKTQLDEEAYRNWYRNHQYSEETLKLQRKKLFNINPKYSILVPVYNTPNEYLQEMIESVLAQTYSNWELCIANASPSNKALAATIASYEDERIKVIDVPQNEGISQNTNEALKIATGDYIGLLDHDDLLTPEALYECTNCVNEEPETEVLYSDEDKIENGQVFSPNFKPDFNKELLRSGNYICHFFVVKKAIIDEIGGFRKEYNGAQDYDIIFRATRKAKKIVHIPRILYHWRIHKESTADNPLSKEYAFRAGSQAISDDLRACGDYGIVEETENMGFYNVLYKTKEYPAVLISVFAKNEKSYLAYKKKLAATLNYPHYKIEWNNQRPDRIIQNTNYEYVLFLDEGILFSKQEALKIMVATCQRKEVGAVSVRLSKGFKTLQAGLKIGNNKVSYLFAGLNQYFTGYMHRASSSSYVRGASISCLLVKTVLLSESVNNLELESREGVAVNWALQIEEAGKNIVYNGRIWGKARYQLPGVKKADLNILKEYWQDKMSKSDPFYNPNLDQSNRGY